MKITKSKHIQIKKSGKPMTFVIVPQENIHLTIEIFSGVKIQVVGFVLAQTPARVSINYILHEGCDVKQNVFALADTNTVEISQKFQFLKPNSTGSFLSTNLVKNGGKISHQAQISIDQYAQKTDSCLQMKGYLLDTKSQVTLVPELDVFANDVKASHAASTVMLQEDQLFYLQSRGLPKDQISGMMVQSCLEQGMQTLRAGDKKIITSYIQPWIS